MTVLMVRETPNSRSAVTTFDYSDLNAYLLLATGFIQPSEDQKSWYDEVERKAAEGNTITLQDVKKMGRKTPLTKLSAAASVLSAVEVFGSGVHRMLVVDRDNPDQVVGIFSQFRLVKFLWENGRSFPVIDRLYPQHLADLGIGSQNVFSIK